MLPSERLKILRTIVETLPLGNQCRLLEDNREWGWDQAWYIDPDRSKLDPPRLCNHTMCLAGWAGLNPALREDGLFTTVSRGGESVRLQGYHPNSGDLGIFFGMSEEDGHELFGANLIDRDGILNTSTAYTEEDRQEVLAFIDERLTRADRTED